MVASDIDLAFLTAAEARTLFARRELSPVDLTLTHLERIARLQSSIRAFITVTEELALREARAAEAALLRGDERPLLGVPLAYKDLYMTSGIRTTAGSKVHADSVPQVTATAVTRLHEAGAVMLGKLSTHEFASGLTREGHPFPPARNPWNIAHVPGGSSSGSGAALASGQAIGALGTDTGGSIRGPGSFCGIAGLKPTYGRCSRYGVVSLSWSLDHVGPMARTVEDVALMLNVLAGYDPKDPASAKAPVEDYTAPLGASIRGLEIGVLRSWYEPSAEPYVSAAVEDALGVLKNLGATVRDVEIPHIDLVKSSNIINRAEAYAYHAADLEDVPEKYEPALRASLMSGGLYMADEYVNAQRARQILKQETAAVLKDVDVLISPTSVRTAQSFEQAFAELGKRAGASFTGLYNMTGLPAITIPCGFDEGGLPIGLQIAGRPFAESTVLQTAHAYERAAGWYMRHPSL